jgi:hypothetical protein
MYWDVSFDLNEGSPIYFFKSLKSPVKSYTVKCGNIVTIFTQIIYKSLFYFVYYYYAYWIFVMCDKLLSKLIEFKYENIKLKISSGSCLTSKLSDKIIKMPSKSHETIPLRENSPGKCWCSQEHPLDLKYEPPTLFNIFANRPFKIFRKAI